jgi:hypothetical protein
MIVPKWQISNPTINETTLLPGAREFVHIIVLCNSPVENQTSNRG